MKKIVFILSMAFLIFGVSSCTTRPKLLILNWGEYINDDVVRLFEETYNCDVIINIAESNELFYAKIKSGTTAYDLVIPSEYMVEKMVENNLLQEVNYDLLPNYDLVKNPLMPGVLGIQKAMFSGNEKYAIPYFWGTFGLMYNKKVVGLEEAIITNGWQAFFEEDKLPKGTRVGMYNIPRFAYAAAMFYHHLSPNEKSKEMLALASKTLSMRQFSQWGTDMLKKGIASDNLDLAFLYTGDFLDTLYIRLEDDPNLNNISFDIFVPQETIAFMDSFVIPKKARHLDMAHKFINFFLNPNNAYENASVVGYCTPLMLAYDEIVSYVGDDEWLSAWAYATKTYYPLPSPNDEVQYKGTPIANFDRRYLNDINTMVNNIKVKK